MQISRPDPAAETTKTAGRRFRLAALTALVFVATLWLILLIDLVAPLDLRQFGVRPRQPAGLLGLLTMPLLHGGPVHLLQNSLPTLLLGGGLLYFYRRSKWRVLPWFWVAPGLFVWMVGEAGSTHFGASGLNFALLGYVGAGGLLRREAGTLALSMAVLFYYGGMLSGILPIRQGVSWEGHLGGLIVGVVLAVIYRNWDIPPRKRYDWEDEEDDDDWDVTREE